MVSVVLICVFLMANDVEPSFHVFICHYYGLFDKVFIQVLCHSYKLVVAFHTLNFKSSFCIFGCKLDRRSTSAEAYYLSSEASSLIKWG